MHLFVLTMLAMVVTDLYRRFGVGALVVEFVALTLFTLTYFIFVERAATGFRPLRPQYCSIYDPYFWWHERFWKLAVQRLDRAFVGTPFKNVISRLLGVRIGRRVFDDGCSVPEKTLATIGDYCTLNAGSVIQCHSQEDGAFKSDYCALDPAAGTTAGAACVSARLAPEILLRLNQHRRRRRALPEGQHLSASDEQLTGNRSFCMARCTT
jgi:non-ribosomal peptide synthetase-like protein